jgi:hypothetical protein
LATLNAGTAYCRPVAQKCKRRLAIKTLKTAHCLSRFRTVENVPLAASNGNNTNYDTRHAGYDRDCVHRRSANAVFRQGLTALVWKLVVPDSHVRHASRMLSGPRMC